MPTPRLCRQAECRLTGSPCDGGLLAGLKGQSVVGQPAPVPAPVGPLLARYRTWMVEERALAATTVRRYETTARRFLVQRAAADGDRLVEGVTAAKVHAFLLEELARVSV